MIPSTPFEGSVLARHTKMSAIRALVIQVLRPFKIQPSSCRSARVCIEKMSEPASGSLAALAPSRLPSHSPGRYRRFCARVPKARIDIVVVQSEAPVAKTSPVSRQP